MRYKYFWKKPKGEIVKDIFTALTIGGVIAITASSPYFIVNLLRSFRHWEKYKKKRISDTFYRLRKEGYLNFEYKNRQLYIQLTSEGRKKAGWFQINSLQIRKPKKWDGKWRIVIFDIPHKNRVKREALRGFLKRLGFHQLQKSVWVHPYNCEDEIRLLYDFFGFTTHELQFIVAERIDSEEEMRKQFRV